MAASTEGGITTRASLEAWPLPQILMTRLSPAVWMSLMLALATSRVRSPVVTISRSMAWLRRPATSSWETAASILAACEDVRCSFWMPCSVRPLVSRIRTAMLAWIPSVSSQAKKRRTAQRLRWQVLGRWGFSGLPPGTCSSSPSARAAA